MIRAILFLFLIVALVPAAAAQSILSAPDAWDAAKSGKLTIIDVRHPNEWRQTGIPKGAKTISYHDPGGEAAFIAKVTAAVKGNKAARIGVICATGGRSGRVYGWLTRAGFTNVVDIQEGMVGRSASRPGWLRRNLPKEKWTPKGG